VGSNPGSVSCVLPASLRLKRSRSCSNKLSWLPIRSIGPQHHDEKKRFPFQNMWTHLSIRLLGLLMILVALPHDASGQRQGDAHAQSAFTPGEIWLDTKGKPINAHGGGMLYYDQTYYWYGENKVGRSWVPEANREWDGYRVDVTGIRCYSSKELHRWKDRGLVLKAVPDDPASDLHPSRVVERPKVAFNPKTREFVMWMHIDTADYQAARGGGGRRFACGSIPLSGQR
jgi:hypothetical protein